MAFTIRQRNGSFYFRSRVPVGLRKRFGRHEIVRALQARNRSEANLIAALVAPAVETAFMTIENNPALDIQEANAVLAAHLTHAQGIFVAARHGLQPASPPVVDDLTSPASASAALFWEQPRSRTSSSLRRAQERGLLLRGVEPSLDSRTFSSLNFRQ